MWPAPMYIERWLKAPVQRQDGSLQERTKGSPQGAVVSPLLANLFLHHGFDNWMRRNHPSIPFERYADDVIVHAKSKAQAEQLLEAIRTRLAECGLELHPEKTRIVYCQDSDRKGQHEHIPFDFLGYTFRPRRAKNYRGKHFVSFLPGVSNKAGKAIRATIRDWRLAATRNNQSLEDLARLVNPSVSGWVDYYGRFYRSALTPFSGIWSAPWYAGRAGSTSGFAVTSLTQPTGWVGWHAAIPICSFCGRLG
jgi:RNA-directed DNA polymerase